MQVDAHSRSQAPVQSFLALLTFQLVILCFGELYFAFYYALQDLWPLPITSSDILSPNSCDNKKYLQKLPNVGEGVSSPSPLRTRTLTAMLSYFFILYKYINHCDSEERQSWNQHYYGRDNQNTLGKYCTTVIPFYATFIYHLQYTMYLCSHYLLSWQMTA